MHAKTKMPTPCQLGSEEQNKSEEDPRTSWEWIGLAVLDALTPYCH